MKKKKITRGNRQADHTPDEIIPNPAGIPGNHDDSDQLLDAHARWRNAVKPSSGTRSYPRYWQRHYHGASL